MPKLTFTEDNIKERPDYLKITEPGFYDLTVSAVHEQLKGGADQWVVRFVTEDELEHTEWFEFEEKLMWKIAHFMRGMGFTVSPGEHEISKESIIGESVRAELKLDKWVKNGEEHSTLRVKKWIPIGGNLPTVKPVAPKPIAKLSKL